MKLNTNEKITIIINYFKKEKIDLKELALTCGYVGSEPVKSLKRFIKGKDELVEFLSSDKIIQDKTSVTPNNTNQKEVIKREVYKSTQEIAVLEDLKNFNNPLSNFLFNKFSELENKISELEGNKKEIILNNTFVYNEEEYQEYELFSIRIPKEYKEDFKKFTKKNKLKAQNVATQMVKEFLEKYKQ